jgi:hypothetical protein
MITIVYLTAARLQLPSLTARQLQQVDGAARTAFINTPTFSGRSN